MFVSQFLCGQPERTTKNSTFQYLSVDRGVARIFQRGGGNTVSHPGYLPDCRVDIHAVFYQVTFFSDKQ